MTTRAYELRTQADKLVSLTQQLIGDIGRLEGVNLDKAGEAQLGQLLVDAFEQVGVIALDDGLADVHREVLYPGRREPVRCAVAGCTNPRLHAHG